MKTLPKAEILRVSRQRDRRKRVAKVLFGLFLVLSLVGLGLGLFHLAFFRVTKVSVLGETDVDRTLIKKFVEQRLAGYYLGLIPKNSIFFLTDNILSETEFQEQFPGLASAELTWPNLNTLVVTVADQPSKILWCVLLESVEKQCYYLSSFGVVYQPAPNFSSLILTEFHSLQPVTKIKEKVINPKTLARAMAVIDFIKNNLMSWSIADWQLLGIEVRPANDFAVKLRSNSEPYYFSQIIFNTDQLIDDLAVNLNSVLNNQDFRQEWSRANGRLEYLDLRFPGKVFYRFEP